MKNKEQIDEIVDTWIDEEELPFRANLKPISRFDDIYPKDEAERQAYWDFIHWYVSQEFQVLMSIPRQTWNDRDFWEDDDAISFHYTSIDYQRAHPFDKYAYRIRKIYEGAKDLAILHSCISDDKGKANTAGKFEDLLNEAFRDKLHTLLDNYRKYPHLMNKKKLFTRIAELNSRIQTCKNIWRKYEGVN